MERRVKRLVLALMTMAAVFMAVPASAEAAKADNTLAVTVPAKKDVKIKKVKAGHYNVKVKAGQKNIPLTVKAGKKKVTSKCRWKISGKKIISITKKGCLTAKKAGKARLTATYKGRKAILTVTVEKAEQPESKKTPEKPKECAHNWEDHWKTAVFEGDVDGQGFVGVCNCGVFTSEEEFNRHVNGIFNIGDIGIHGKKAKGKVDTNETVEETEDGMKITIHYRIETKYIEYKECTLCGARRTLW